MPGGPQIAARQEKQILLPGGFFFAPSGIASDRSRRWWLGLEGELRNLRQLRSELSARGLAEEDDSAPAILATICNEIGFERGLSRMEGEFLVAAWDSATGTLHLARDRMGARSLYAWKEAETFCFSSEPPSAAVDPQAMRQLVGLGLLPGSRTPWKGVHRLPAGSRQEVDEAGLREHRYWDTGVAPDGYSGAINRWAKSLEYAVELAVRIRLGEPTAVLTSGGLYAGAVAKIAAARRKDGVRAFSVKLGEPTPEKAAAVELTAERLPEILEKLADFSYPLISPGVPAWLVAAEAARNAGFRNILGGFGGAQVFGQDRVHRLARLGPAAGLIGKFSGVLPAERRRVAEVYKQPWARRLCGWRWKAAAEDEMWAEVDALGRECPQQDGLAAVLWMERRLFLPEALQQVHLQLGLSAPLLDPALIAFVATLPLGVLNWGPRGLFGGAFSPVPRQPMQVPMRTWLAGPAAPLLKGLEERLEGWFPASQIQAERAALASGADRSQLLWAFLVLAGWRERRGRRATG